MSQDAEKFLYFNVGLLKDSFAVDALVQDALKHHMIDQLDKLIALRLTEYYEILASGVVHPVASVSIAAGRNGRGGMTTTSATESNGEYSLTDQMDNHHSDEESAIATSLDVEQNAEEAADYWTLL